MLSAPAPAALGCLFAASAAAAPAAAAPPAAALLPAVELPGAPQRAGLLTPGLGLDGVAGFAALPAPASVGPAQGWPLTPSSSSAFCSVGSRLSTGPKSLSVPHALSAGPPTWVEPCAGVTCAGAAAAAPLGRPGAHPSEEAGVSLSGRARRRGIAAREAAAREPGKGPVQGRAQGAPLEPCRAAETLSARRGAERAVVHRPAKLRRLLPEATQLLLLSSAAGALLGPMGVAQGAA